MTDKTTLIICPSFQAANALRGYYARNKNITVVVSSPTGHRADKVIVMPMGGHESETDRAAWAKATTEHFANRVAPGGEFIVL